MSGKSSVQSHARKPRNPVLEVYSSSINASQSVSCKTLGQEPPASLANTSRLLISWRSGCPVSYHSPTHREY